MDNDTEIPEAPKYEEFLREQVEVGWQQAERGQLEPHDMADIVQQALAAWRQHKL